MYKLIFLTLLGLTTTLIVFGEGGHPEPERSAATVKPAEPTPTESGTTEIIPAVQQTPQQERPFAGPALRPSPEYVGDNPVESLADAPTDTLYVTGKSVNFRAGPTTSDSVVGRLSLGQTVMAVGPKSGDWIEVRDSQGRTGFMSARFLSAHRP